MALNQSSGIADNTYLGKLAEQIAAMEMKHVKSGGKPGEILNRYKTNPPEGLKQARLAAFIADGILKDEQKSSQNDSAIKNYNPNEPTVLDKMQSQEGISALPIRSDMYSPEVYDKGGIGNMPEEEPIQAASGGLLAFNGEEESLVPPVKTQDPVETQAPVDAQGLASLVSSANPAEIPLSEEEKAVLDRANAPFEPVKPAGDMFAKAPSATRTDAGEAAPPEVKYNYGLLIPGGQLTSDYGKRKSPITGKEEDHFALDVGAAGNKIGTPVSSLTAGTVTYAGEKGTAGNHVEVLNADGTVTSYSHLNHINVKKGDAIEAGVPLGGMGKTGRTTAPHVHVAYKSADGKPLDAKSLFVERQKPTVVADAPTDTMTDTPPAAAGSMGAPPPSFMGGQKRFDEAGKPIAGVASLPAKPTPHQAFTFDAVDKIAVLEGNPDILKNAGRVNGDPTRGVNMGPYQLNSTGALKTWQKEYGEKFGVTADPVKDYAEFKKQVAAASANDPTGFLDSQRNIAARTVTDTQRRLPGLGLPPEIANDRGVILYFADGAHQLGSGLAYGKNRTAAIQQAWKDSNGDKSTFLANVSKYDKDNIPKYFPDTKHTVGLANRIDNRTMTALDSKTFRQQAKDLVQQGQGVATDVANQARPYINKGLSALGVTPLANAKPPEPTPEQEAAKLKDQRVAAQTKEQRAIEAKNPEKFGDKTPKVDDAQLVEVAKTKAANAPTEEERAFYRNLGLALMGTGAGMMKSKARTLLGAAGEGLEKGVESFTAGISKEEDRKLKQATNAETARAHRETAAQRRFDTAQKMLAADLKRRLPDLSDADATNQSYRQLIQNTSPADRQLLGMSPEWVAQQLGAGAAPTAAKLPPGFGKAKVIKSEG